MIRTICLAALVLTSGCVGTKSQTAQSVAIATLLTPEGKPIGNVTISSSQAELTLSTTINSKPGSTHGLHLHTVGKCESPAFVSAGPHLNPTGHEHGAHNPRGAHLGDLPNVVIGPTGVGSIMARLPITAADAQTLLFDGDGTAIVLHAAQDDYRTDPSGNSGARIACGVLNRV